MLTCKKLVENGSEYVEGDLSAWQRFKYKSHMFMCVHCKRYILQLRQTIQMISLSRHKEASDEVVEKLSQEYSNTMEQAKKP